MLRLFKAIKRYQDRYQPLWKISLILLLITLADGIVSFALPVYMERSLQDLALVGLIFGSSSVFGLITAIVFGSEQRGRTFKPYFGLTFLLALAAYILSLQADSWYPFLLIMAFWGAYYEAINFGMVDFLSRFSYKREHARSSGLVSMFGSLGYLLGPVIASFVILEDRISIKLSILLMVLAAFGFSWWFGRKKVKPEPPKRILNFFSELKVWLKVGKKGLWVLISFLWLTIFGNSLIWSMGPILLVDVLGQSSALVMACFVLPEVFLQGYTGHLADKKGKKQFLILGLMISGLFISFFGFGRSLGLKIISALGSAVGASFVWPAGDGLFIDMLDGTVEQKEEIAGMRGMAGDLGYIIGPILAGFLGKAFGLPATFLLYGVFLILGALTIRVFWQ